MAKDIGNSHGTMTSDNHAALWHGRFEQGPDAWAVEFETSIHVDERMAFDDINGSIAHARMLGETGILTKEESRQITDELAVIKKDLESGKLKIDYSAEDIHSFIEAELTDRLGDTGRKLHTGRSRNDQIALDERLYLKRTIPDLCDRIVTLIEALVRTAEKHTDDLIPGYTHMQHAQPVTLAHHLCAWAWSLVRDWKRLQDALKRIDESPLGSGALAGSGLPLDRKSVADQLGFSGVTDNSLDSVSDRDYCIELVSDFSLLQMHLSRFCEEIVLWSTTEFSFVDLSEKWSTGSSIMPQKKNPDFAELIRGRTGKIYGDLVSLLTMMKGLPLSYDRDLQEDKEPLFDAFDCVLGNVTVFTYMISSAHWNTGRMAAGCRGGFLNATDVADYLVRKGMPFRTAHGVAAAAVRKAIELNCSLEELPPDQFKACSPLIDDDIYTLITPEACVEARKTDGGPAPQQVLKQIGTLQKFCTTARSAG
jgi:argininosuccinate lyase